MTLYELTGEMLQLQSILEEEDNPEYIRIALDTMEGLEGEIEAKADGYARIIRNLTADVEGLKVEIERLNNRKRTIENNISSLKNRLEDSMIQIGKEKFKTELFSFNIQANPPAVVLDTEDINRIPAQYVGHEPKLDKKQMLADLKAGADLSGIAHLEQSRSLRIK